MTTTPMPSPGETNLVDSSTRKVQADSRLQTESDTTPKSPFSIILEVEVPIPYQALANLIRSLDAEEIQAVAMAKLQWGDDQNLTRYILETIALGLEAFDAD